MIFSVFDMMKTIISVKFCILFLFCCLSYNHLSAQTVPSFDYQERYYVSFSGGYAFGVSAGDQGGNFLGQAVPANLMSNNRGTLGTGIPLNLRLGYYLTNNISLDLGVQYFSGARSQVQTVMLPNNLNMIQAEAFTEQLRINPSISFYVPIITNMLDAYSRLGLMVPVAGAAFIDAKGSAMAIDNAPALAGVNFERMERISGNFGMGFTGALGLEYALKPRLGLFAEVEAMHLNITRNQGEFTKFHFVDGDGNEVQDLRSVLPTSLLETNYVEALGENSNNLLSNPTGFNPERPMDMPTSTSFYHHLSTQVGLKFRF